MEHWEIYDKWVDFSCNDVLGNHLVGPRVSHLAEVEVRWQDVGLDLVISDFTGVQLDDKVFFQCFHCIVFLQMGKDLLRADCNLTVDQVTSQLILPRLFLQRDVLFVQLIRVGFS